MLRRWFRGKNRGKLAQEFVENGAVMILNGLFDCNLDTELCEMKAF